MPLPRWLAHINKRVFNPMEVRRGARPVLIHTGRSSGKTYRTPLDAHALPDGYLFIPLYGPRTDWVKNVLLAQAARLCVDGHEIELQSPRLVKKKTSGPWCPRPRNPIRASRASPSCCAWTSADKAQNPE